MDEMCPYCQRAPIERRIRGGRPPKTCGAVACRAAMRAISQRRAHQLEAERRKGLRQNGYGLCDCGVRFLRARVNQVHCSDVCRTRARKALWAQRANAANADRVEQQIEAAKRARLARERATGQRTYTIDADSTYVRQDGLVVTVRGGWMQKPGAGEINGDADPNGFGWNA